MAVDDRTRFNLHRKLEAVLGTDEADTLMAHLPPVTWNDVATKHDLRGVSSAVDGSVALLRTEIDGVRTQLRTEIDSLGTQLRTEIDSLGTELRGEIHGVRAEVDNLGTQLRAEIHVLDANLRTAFVDGHNRQIKWLVTFAAGWSTLLFSVFALVR